MAGRGHRSLGPADGAKSGKDADVILLRPDDLTVFPVTDPAATIVSAGWGSSLADA
ncbi:hypothetical protein AB0E10_08510 [Streptomyces sp. NPDC048045]|uniref:hypothetical protein n=1 Tax=Streptomyces sp. NPDC048045 TaxID=3154710 RepID=UPI0034120B8D